MLFVALVCGTVGLYVGGEAVVADLDFAVLVEERVVLLAGGVHVDELLSVGGDGGFVFGFEGAYSWRS